MISYIFNSDERKPINKMKSYHEFEYKAINTIITWQIFAQQQRERQRHRKKTLNIDESQRTYMNFVFDDRIGQTNSGDQMNEDGKINKYA